MIDLLEDGDLLANPERYQPAKSDGEVPNNSLALVDEFPLASFDAVEACKAFPFGHAVYNLDSLWVSPSAYYVRHNDSLHIIGGCLVLPLQSTRR